MLAQIIKLSSPEDVRVTNIIEPKIGQKIILKANYTTPAMIAFRFITNLDDARTDNLMSNYIKRFICFQNSYSNATKQGSQSKFNKPDIINLKSKIIEPQDYAIGQITKIEGHSYIIGINDATDGLYLKHCTLCDKYTEKLEIAKSKNQTCILKCNGCGFINKYNTEDVSTLYGCELQY